MKLTVPTLLINSSTVEHNIDVMLNKLSDPGKFRPHFKTHQSKEIGRIFKRKGISKITVSSVKMAQYFEGEWDDITIAFPVNINEIESINQISSRINLNLLVESVFTANFLSENIGNDTGIFIKIDGGYNRTGLPYNDGRIKDILKIIDSSKKLKFIGFITQSGHTYNARGIEKIQAILDENIKIRQELKLIYGSTYPQMIFSYGDTPSCSIVDNLDFFDEIRPGNFVYYDVMQYHIGSCKLDEIAVVVACPVVAIHPERNEIVIYGGGVHLSKESIEADNGFKLFGYVVKLDDNYHRTEPIPGVYVKSLSQEHGIIKADDKLIIDTKPGDWIGILPIHSCLTANLLRDNQIII